MNVTIADMARAIEHTLLRPEATPQQIDVLCDEAKRYGFAGVCVNPIYVRRAAENIGPIGPIVVAAVGFPRKSKIPTIEHIPSK